MLSTSSRHSLRRATFLRTRVLSPLSQRYKSSSAVEKEPTSSRLHPEVYPFDENGNAGAAEVVKFPAVNGKDNVSDTQPVLLNSKEHAVGYLSRILNARVYEAAIETELQEAKNLSAVRHTAERQTTVIDAVCLMIMYADLLVVCLLL